MRALLFLLALTCLCSGPAVALTYEMHDLGAICPYAINSLGQVVGTMGGADGEVHAFIWQNGQTTDLGPGWTQSVNDLGQVAVCLGTTYNCEAAIWQNGVVTKISGINPGYAEPFVINNNGQAVGTTFDASTRQGWIWQSGNLAYLGTMGDAGSRPIALNNVGQVIGYTIKPNNYVGSPFIWQGGVMSPIPGLLTGGGLAAINDRGQIVGEDIKSEGYRGWQEAYILQNGTKTFLGNLSGVSAFPLLSRATGINNHSQVVGWADTGESSPSGGVSRAFMWEDGVMSDLGTLGGTYSGALAISDSGWIVGYSETADGQQHGVLWTPVPEPSSMLAMLCGIGSLCSVMRKRRSA